jgi:hypothetical protein
MKSEQTGKGLSGTVVYELWRSAVALYLLVLACLMNKWPINPFTTPNPAYSHTYAWQHEMLQKMSCQQEFQSGLC